MKRIVATTLAGALVATTLALTGASSASAATTEDAPVGPGSSLAAIQKAATIATDRRINALTTAITRAEGNKYLSDDHQAAVLATLQTDLDAMHSLAAEVAADTTAASALDDYRAIFTDYRVFAVAIPQSVYAAGADALTESALPRLNRAYDRLDARDLTPELEALLAEMAQKIDEAEAASASIASDALAVTPASYDADHTVMADIRIRLAAATTAARDAAQLGREIAEALR